MSSMMAVESLREWEAASKQKGGKQRHIRVGFTTALIGIFSHEDGEDHSRREYLSSDAFNMR